jgi:hypothetical protein
MQQLQQDCQRILQCITGAPQSACANLYHVYQRIRILSIKDLYRAHQSIGIMSIRALVSCPSKNWYHVHQKTALLQHVGFSLVKLRTLQGHLAALWCSCHTTRTCLLESCSIVEGVFRCMSCCVCRECVQKTSSRTRTTHTRQAAADACVISGKQLCKPAHGSSACTAHDMQWPACHLHALQRKLPLSRIQSPKQSFQSCSF